MSKTGRVSQSLAARSRWLFTKEGLPVLISIITGLVIGFFVSGVAGLIIATIAGFAVLALFKRFPFHFNPWQVFATELTPVVGKLCFSLVFLLPIADYLTLPSGHTPDTLPKYLSIVFAVPKNLFSKPGMDIFPGFVFIVFAAIILMYWGSTNLEKKDHWLLAFGGLVLYTLSPTITSFLMGRPGLRIVMDFFAAGYYFAWLGLALLLAAKVLPRFLKAGPQPAPNPYGMMSLLAPMVAIGAMAQLSAAGGGGHSFLQGLFDFESSHHFIAGIFSGGAAAVSSGVIVGQSYKEFDEDGASSEDTGDVPEEWERARETGEVGPPPEEPGDVPEDSGDVPETGEVGPPPEEPGDVPEPPAPQGPVPSTDPKDPPGTTIEHNADGSITKRQPDGTWGTKYTDGTTYAEGPDGSSYTSYPDGTTKEYSPETGLQVTRPNGDIEITTADGRTGGAVHNGDGSMDITSPYGGKLHFPKDGEPTGSLTTADGDVFTANGDGSASITTPEGKLEIDKDGNMSGNLDDGQGNKMSIGKDGSMDIETAEGDKITVNADGMKAKFADGSYINTDADGNPTSGHIKGEDRTVDINTDDKGVTHIKDDKGNWIDMKDGQATDGHLQDEEGTVDINTDEKGTIHIKTDKGESADINKDGSGQMTDADGNTATQDSDGNATLTDKNGTKWVAKNDGSGFITDKQGNRIDLGKDGSLTVKDAAGKVTHYTPDQVGQMKAQAAGGLKQGGGIDTAPGGN